MHSFEAGDNVMIGKRPPPVSRWRRILHRVLTGKKWVRYTLPIGTIAGRNLLNAQGYPDSVLLELEGQQIKAGDWPELAQIWINVYGAPTEPGLIQLPDLRSRTIVGITSEYS